MRVQIVCQLPKRLGSPRHFWVILARRGGFTRFQTP
jgi:hypothetical protein